MKTATVQDILDTMTREELRTIAKHLNVPRGRNRPDTLKNIAEAVTQGKARLSGLVSIQTPRTNSTPPLSLATIKVRTHKPNKVVFLRTEKTASFLGGMFLSSFA